MPDNQIPSKSTPGTEPAEFNFDQSSDSPRIKRRTLKAKPATGLTKPEDGAVNAARELEREAPPRTESPAPAPAPAKQTAPVSAQPKSVPVIIRAATTTPSASATPPPKTTPSAATPANGSTTTRPITGSNSYAATSPHGTRPATLYYTSPTRKEAAPASTAKATPAPAAASTPLSPTSKAATTPANSPSPMKTVSGSASTPSSTASTTPGASAASAAARATAAGAPRTSSPQPDYRANVDRQSREQKSVGSILSYVVYGLLAFFLISSILAVYGAKTIFDRLHDQSVTVTEFDQKYADANKELNAKLVVTQDTLTQVQAQATRAQDVIVKQQEEINALKSSLNDSITALKTEKAVRTQDSAAIRARLKELENRSPFSTTNTNR